MHLGALNLALGKHPDKIAASMPLSLPTPTQAFVAASLVIAGTYLYSTLSYRRFKQNAHLPQLPSSLVWGHLITFDAFTKKGAADRHPDAIFSEMHAALGKPPIMLVDNWPIVPPMVIVASHEVAEQLSRPSATFQYSALKSSSVDRIVDLIGPNSILLKQVSDCLHREPTTNPSRQRTGSRSAGDSTPDLHPSTS